MIRFNLLKNHCSECHRFPLNDKNRLDKWIAAVGKPDWKPTKASRICNLHFNKKDIIQGMGYQRSYLRKNAVPKDYSSFVTENELVDTVMLKPKKVCNTTSINKSINTNETCSLEESVAWDSNNLKNNINTIENNRSNTFDIRDRNQSVQKTIPHPNTFLTNERYKFIQTYSKEICNSANIKSVSSSETYVLDKNAVRNHTNLKNNVNTTIENYGLCIFNTENQNQSIKNTISHSDKKCSFSRSDSNKIYNASSSKSVSCNEIYVSEKSVALDHNYSKYRNVIMKKNGSNIFGTRNTNQLVQQTILQPSQKRKFIRIGLKNVPNSINFNYKIRREIDFINATKKINELSKNVRDMKVKNRTLQQKLRRYNERVTLIKKLFDLLQQEKLISGDSLQLIRKQLERLILQTSQNKDKNESQLQIRKEN